MAPPHSIARESLGDSITAPGPQLSMWWRSAPKTKSYLNPACDRGGYVDRPLSLSNPLRWSHAKWLAVFLVVFCFILFYGWRSWFACYTGFGIANMHNTFTLCCFLAAGWSSISLTSNFTTWSFSFQLSDYSMPVVLDRPPLQATGYRNLPVVAASWFCGCCQCIIVLHV